MSTGDILGVHHIKIPVTDLVRSRAWYEQVFDLEPFIEWPDDEGVVRGVSYRTKGGLALALREQPDAARGIAGFDPFAIMLRGRSDAEHWATRLDGFGIAHSPVTQIPIGWLLRFEDPDGLELRFYTLDEHGADPEGHRPAETGMENGNSV